MPPPFAVPLFWLPCLRQFGPVSKLGNREYEVTFTLTITMGLALTSRCLAYRDCPTCSTFFTLSSSRTRNLILQHGHP